MRALALTFTFDMFGQLLDGVLVYRLPGTRLHGGKSIKKFGSEASREGIGDYFLPRPRLALRLPFSHALGREPVRRLVYRKTLPFALANFVRVP